MDRCRSLTTGGRFMDISTILGAHPPDRAGRGNGGVVHVVGEGELISRQVRASSIG